MGDVTRNLKKYCMSKSLSDVTLVTQGKEFSAHRLILSCGSPVFERMFQIEMQEAIEGRVEMNDIEPNVLKEMLHYLYNGEFIEKDNISVELAMELLKSAHKYEMEDLKTKCSNRILKDISYHNAVELYVFGDNYDVEVIKDRAVYMLKQNKETIFKDPETFLQMTTTHPDLVFDCFVGARSRQRDTVQGNSYPFPAMQYYDLEKVDALGHTAAVRCNSLANGNVTGRTTNRSFLYVGMANKY